MEKREILLTMTAYQKEKEVRRRFVQNNNSEGSGEVLEHAVFTNKLALKRNSFYFVFIF